MTLLTFLNVSKGFDGITAVNDVSFTVDRGEVVGFLGPNGAGKSTTMRMITQFYEPDKGEIQFDSRPIDEVGREAKRHIGYLPENNPLYSDMLVVDYLRFVARLRDLDGAAATKAIDAAVGRTGIGSVFFRPIGTLSKGYRQRVGLAQAILHSPDLLILDEPTEGLDPNQRVEIRRLIVELGRERTVMLSTHVLPEVENTCSRLLVIHEGAIVADGSVEDLTAKAKGAVQILVEVAGDGVADVIGAMPGVQHIEPARGGEGRAALTVTTDGTRDIRPDIFEQAKTKGWTLFELHQETRNLEELFRQLTTTSEGS
jgi:ABC-2 type transport system ATP-binding protein